MKDPANCMKCGAPLTSDDIGMYRKAVNRGAQECMCLDCLAEKLKVSRPFLEEKIAFLKARGCTLFQ